MTEIPEFEEAVSDFRRFLTSQGQANDIVWVFRDDLWLRGPGHMFMRFPPPVRNESLAEKVYAEGRERGLVGITGVVTARDHLAATIWFPKFPEEEVQGWNQGLKLAVREPLPAAREVGALRWLIVKCLPGYRSYQRSESFIGSRRWAAA